MRRRGMAMVWAVVLLALVALAAAALTRSVAADAARTRRFQHEAQERQLRVAETLTGQSVQLP